MRILLVAEESAGVQALRLAVERGHDVVAALTRGGEQRGTTVATVAEQLGVPRLEPRLVRDPQFAQWIAAERIDLLLNVHSLLIADAAVLDAPAIGSFNLHPGPLPRYAGLNTPSWAIYEGQTRHAVTVHWMTAEVDAGLIAYEAWFDIEPSDTGLRVAAKAVRHGMPLLARLLDDAAEGGADGVPGVPQARTGGRWYGREAPHGGRLPWRLTARQVVDLVRAADYAPFPSPWGAPSATLEGREVAVARASATDEPTDAPAGTVGLPDGDGVRVAAADAWVRVERVRCDGVPAKPRDLLNPGARFAEDHTDDQPSLH